MAKPELTSSASLHLKLGAFGVLFTALAVSFTPMTAFSPGQANSVEYGLRRDGSIHVCGASGGVFGDGKA